MLKRNLTLIAVACGLLAGCEFNRTQMIKMEDRLSTPYQDPQIIVDIQTRHIELEVTQSMKREMGSFLAQLDTPALIKAAIRYPNNWSKKHVSMLKSHTKSNVSDVSLFTFQPAEIQQVTVVGHYAVARVVGCDDTAAFPETFDGKTGYSPNHACASIQNQVAMVADPRDFLQGKIYQNNSSVQGVSAVEAFNQGSLMPLQTQPISVGDE
ncbi:CpaD family pilus assembly lipoprotein [Vibrio tapetis subsp. quintayensis]|uniref:CpaD family pilus assembly lipoprotein n=1 Tax=Vibrio tapetis TaxID=52443 RepID=UPI0025B620C2|nr:CpaD family pilus assembly lipoprotein [Vibrio tapetis]MDN3680455.1 CpaD family pilus assembly lipoprotein [Vibrio tapetis subsp. quintayensis]